MERGPGSDLDDLLDDLLTPCAGTLRTITLTICKTGDELSQLVILYFIGSYSRERTP